MRKTAVNIRKQTWGLWANTGDVDPVLARMLHLLRYHWGSDPNAARALSELDAVVAGTRADDALSRRCALLVVDRGLRRDLPRPAVDPVDSTPEVERQAHRKASRARVLQRG